MNGITKDTFSQMSHEDKLNVLFDLSIETHERLSSLEKNKIINMALTFGGGFAGGGLIMLSRFIFS